MQTMTREQLFNRLEEKQNEELHRIDQIECLELPDLDALEFEEAEIMVTQFDDGEWPFQSFDFNDMEDGL